jgi:hypothetical protein
LQLSFLLQIDVQALLALIPGPDSTMTCDEANAMVCEDDALGTCCTDLLKPIVGCVLPTLLDGCSLTCVDAPTPDAEPEPEPGLGAGTGTTDMMDVNCDECAACEP